MSDTFCIVCDGCKVSLWIGQTGGAGPNFLYTAPEYNYPQAAFFYAHCSTAWCIGGKDHQLRFIDSQHVPEDYAELPNTGDWPKDEDEE